MDNKQDNSLEKGILIVGAGPVGLTLAIELNRRSIPFVIVDKAPGPAPLIESRALAFNARSQSILAASGVTKEIETVGHPVHRVNICWNGEVSNTVELTRSKAIDGAVIICPQGTIERTLIEKLKERGVDIAWNTELLEFTENEQQVVAKVADSKNNIRGISVRYIAGCDGAHSEVRKQGGFTFDGESDSQIWTLADVTLKDDRFKHVLTADLRSGAAFATMPISDRTARFIHNGPNLLQTHPFKDLCTQVQWESEFKVSYRLVKQYSRGRIYLCGDAAHIHSPVGGRGMNLGIEDAATLAYLIEQRQENTYSLMRRPVAEKVLKQTRNQTTQMNASSWFSSKLKQFGPKLLELPVAKRTFLKTIYGLDTPVPIWLDND